MERLQWGIGVVEGDEALQHNHHTVQEETDDPDQETGVDDIRKREGRIQSL